MVKEVWELLGMPFPLRVLLPLLLLHELPFPRLCLMEQNCPVKYLIFQIWYSSVDQGTDTVYQELRTSSASPVSKQTVLPTAGKEGGL